MHPRADDGQDAATTGRTSSRHDVHARADRPGPRTAIRYAVIASMLLLMLGFVALGVWQLERRVWKLALIERVEARVHALPSEAPDRERWSKVNASDDEYRHVRLAGTFLDDRATRVQALTAYGSGFWSVVPLRLPDGDIVLVNRGYIARVDAPVARPAPSGEPAGVTGLLRMTEPRGRALKANDPAGGRWYSRDVAAIGKARDLQRVAPYFVDADAASGERLPDDAPIGGLTVIAFRNDHLLYAITWFVLATLCVAALWRLLRSHR